MIDTLESWDPSTARRAGRRAIQTHRARGPRDDRDASRPHRVRTAAPMSESA
jgi:hypothetical protein